MRADNLKIFFPNETEIREELIREIPVVLSRYLVGGRLLLWGGPYREVFSPVLVRTSSGVIPKGIGKYPLMTERESMDALGAARKAFGDGTGLWPAASARERIACFETLIHGIISKREEIVNLLMWEIGKSRKDSEKEFDRTIRYVRGTIDALEHTHLVPPEGIEEQGIVGKVRRVPLGVVLVMGPFNYPFFETFTALAPALLTGNTAVFKTPRFGTLLFQPILEALHASFPAGVVNSLSGDGRQIIPPLLSSGMVDALAFIGTSRTATYLRGLHPKPHRLRCVLGLEAKNPAIVMADADLDMTVRECISGALTFNGQRCAALKIFFVHSSVVQPFLKRFAEAIGELHCGMPWDENVFVTPLTEPDKPMHLASLVKDAVDLGARIINDGGGTVSRTFFYPALLYPVTQGMRLFHEEQFGPVVPVVPFDDPAELLRHIIDSDYGQQASIFGQDEEVLAQVASCLVQQVSRVNINCQCQRGPDTAPFTGRKDSAEGNLSISDGLTAFTVPSLISTKDTDRNRNIINFLAKKHT